MRAAACFVCVVVDLVVTLSIMVVRLGLVCSVRFQIGGSSCWWLPCLVRLRQQRLQIAMHEAEREHGVNRMNVISLSDVPLLEALTNANIKRSWLLVITSASTLLSCCWPSYLCCRVASGHSILMLFRSKHLLLSSLQHCLSLLLLLLHLPLPLLLALLHRLHLPPYLLYLQQRCLACPLMH